MTDNRNGNIRGVLLFRYFFHHKFFNAALLKGISNSMQIQI
jgi:hypothetical protein